MTESPTIELESQPDVHARPQTILIVDDDRAQVAALDFRLRKLGYQTLLAYSGSEALEAADEVPDLVLLDLRLPDMDGLAVCERLADSPRICGLPIIILSAMERPDIVRRARSAGGGFYVRKPYDPNVLLTLIEHSLAD